MDRPAHYGLKVTPPQFDAILTGLRLLGNKLESGEVTPNDGDLGEILTCSGEHPGLTGEQCHDLADAFNGPELFLNVETGAPAYTPPAGRLADALRAIRARIDGVFDDPALLRFGPLSDTETDCKEIANRALAAGDTPTPAYVVVQEGGSSGEIYIHAAESDAAAEDFRVSCAKSGYRTSGVFEVSAALAAHGEELYELLEDVAKAELEYADVPDDEDDDEPGEPIATVTAGTAAEILAPPAAPGPGMGCVYAVYNLDPAGAIHIHAAERRLIHEALHGTPYERAHVRNRTLVGGGPLPVPDFRLPEDADALRARLTER